MKAGTIKVAVLDTGLALGPELPMLSPESLTSWHKVWVEILICSYTDLPAYLITLDPQPWSLMREISNESAKKVDGHEYLVAFEARCSKSLLEAVAESEDFRRGLLLLSSEFSDELMRDYDRVFSSGTAPALPLACGDVLLCVADGAVLWWLNPSRSYEELIEIVAKASHQFGFRLSFRGD